MNGDGDILDEVLQVLSSAAPDFENGNTNHAPMVVETLVSLGRDEAVVPWLDGYRGELRDGDAPRPGLPEDWREYLGVSRRWPEWLAYFQAQFADQSWQDVLDLWSGRLAPGFAAEATHGVIRTAHAVRAVAAKQTPSRLQELAQGLAYWAATFAEIPVVGGRSVYDVEVALKAVPALEIDRSGNITQTLGRLDASSGFAPGDLAETDDALRPLSDVTRTFAGVYLSNAGVPASLFAVVHAVTGPSSVRLLAPHISADNTLLLVSHAWHTAAAIYAVYVTNRQSYAAEALPASREELVDRAIGIGGAHAIKLVEACLREYEKNPQPVFVAAAADAGLRLDG